MRSVLCICRVAGTGAAGAVSSFSCFVLDERESVDTCGGGEGRRSTVERCDDDDAADERRNIICEPCSRELIYLPT